MRRVLMVLFAYNLCQLYGQTAAGERLMMVVVTFVSLCVHVYTIGYMSDDPGYQRFFAYISLFTFSMLMLVMANNFMQLFFGWEAVGMVSYLLIGFWYTRPSAIFANPFSSLTGRVTELTRSRMYICTTYIPARLPVFVTSTLTAVAPSRPIRFFLRRRLLTANVV